MNAKATSLKKAYKALELSATTPITEARDFELTWKALKLFLQAEGHETKGAKHVFSTAFQLGFLKSEGIWLEILEDRNKTVHTYDERLAREMCERIRSQYLPDFKKVVELVAGP